MRDLLLALPAPADPAFTRWLAGEWESQDPNHLHLGGWLFAAGSLNPVPLEDVIATA